MKKQEMVVNGDIAKDGAVGDGGGCQKCGKSLVITDNTNHDAIALTGDEEINSEINIEDSSCSTSVSTTTTSTEKAFPGDGKTDGEQGKEREVEVTQLSEEEHKQEG